MEEVIGIVYSTSEQHTDTSSTLITRDHEGAEKDINFLKEFSPYTSDHSHSINGPGRLFKYAFVYDWRLSSRKKPAT